MIRRWVASWTPWDVVLIVAAMATLAAMVGMATADPTPRPAPPGAPTTSAP